MHEKSIVIIQLLHGNQVSATIVEGRIVDLGVDYVAVREQAIGHEKPDEKEVMLVPFHAIGVVKFSQLTDQEHAMQQAD